MVTFIRSDLEFILEQIEISEQLTAGADPATLIQHFSLPYGLREVDGRNNNLLHPEFGAADTLFPRIVPSNPINLEPNGNPIAGESFFGQFNNNYGIGGNVVDSAPRTISNLIVDQSVNNPAALHKALQLAEVADVAAAEVVINDLRALVDAAPDAASRAVAVQNLRDGVAGFGVEMAEDFSLFIANVATDEGLSASFNSWFTFFGQFFDHGLDLVTKGNNGTVFVPLLPDDPLITHGPDGIAGTGDEITNPALKFMALTRATPTMVDPDGAGPLPATAEHTNTTTSWVDQNQTYTSHASHQVFLREYTLNAANQPVSTGKLLDGGPDGGLATWAQIKAQAQSMLGIQLTDYDVGNVPLLRTDAYGKFIPAANGYAQVIVNAGLDGILNTDDDNVVSGTPANPINLFDVFGDASNVQSARTGHAFLDDIAHSAAPFNSQTGLALTADSDNGVGLSETGTYDNELLDAHKVTGDGRGNENIALTTVHHVFHSEHNSLVEQTKAVILATGDAAFIAQWQLPDGSWNGERLFQAAKFGTEMQYQHLVFEEFARKVQPLVNLFGPYNAEIDPSIVAEFAHVVYRFGHSMLDQDVARMNPDGTANDVGLIDAFLNPIMFDAGGTADVSAGAIIRGSTRQVGNEIDEFVVGALRNNLLGLPLDLPVLNIARARDTGAPTLNEARAQFYAGTGDEQLKPYESWVDFALHAKNELSIVNFIAAYGTHASITSATTLAEKREAATLLVLGDGSDGDGVTIRGVTYTDRGDFLNATGAYAPDGAGANDDSRGGLNKVDLWIGGLAEAQQPFGGLLGSTFNFVFETQMEHLQDSDRFYYLNRLAGTHFLTELEGNSFAQMVINNTDLGEDGMHLPGDIFSVPNWILEVDQSKQVTGIDDGVADGVDRGDPTGESIFQPLVVRGPNYLKYTGGDHVVLGGTNNNDTLIAGLGDDTIWGDGGNDRIEGGAGVDQLIGGDGDDIITDINGDDNIKGGAGNDVVNSGDGFDLILLGDGNDFSVGGEDANETFGGEGNDYIIAGDDADTVFGDAGDDWIEGGTGNDLLQGDFGAPFQDSKHVGNDIIMGGAGNDDYDSETGDDIMLADDGIERNEGMLGFDWVTYKNDALAADADMDFTGLLPPDVEAIRDRFDNVEGLSGWDRDDTLRGDDTIAADLLAVDEFAQQNNALNNAQQIALINGLSTLLGGATSFSSGNIILGGGGSDLMEGRGGDDLLDGDAKLNVRLSIRQNNDGTGLEIGTADGMTTAVSSTNALLNGKSLVELMFAGTLNPGQLTITREILYDTATNGSNPADTNVDVALFSDVRANYTITRSGDRFIVAHTTIGAGIPDNGIDTLRNMEVARFADGDLSLINQAPTGVPVINDQTPTETQALNANALGVDDGNGIVGAFSYQWQSAPNVAGVPGAFTDIAGATNQAFTPTQGEVDEFLRVVVTFTDGLGNVETVTSAATTSVVGDFFNGLAVTDIFVGTSGDDIANGNGGADLLSGLAGDDQLNGGGADDILNGGAGNDTLNGGAGNNTASYDGATAGVTVSLAVAGPQNTGGAGTDTLIAIQNLIGSGQGDSLTGDVNNNNISGGAGDDTIVGAGGNDTLTGGAGSDSLNGGGGAADVAVFAGAVGTYTVSTNAGNDIVVTADAGADGADTLVGIENLNFSGVNYAVVTGTIGNNPALNGGANSQAIFGLAGVDAIDGGAGNDLILGGAGNDTITQSGANGGRDIVNGGAGGNDTFVVNGNAAVEVYRVYARADAVAAGITGLNANSDIVITRNTNGVVGLVTNANVIAELDEIEEIVINTGGGADTVLTVGNFNPTNLNFNTITVNGSTSNETVDVSGLTSAHRVVFTSNGGVDTVVGERPQDVINMDTTLNGTSGNDVLITCIGKDTLNGGDGNDTLNGGSGIDVMTGEEGSDIYYVDHLADIVVERTGQGSQDTILSTVNVRLDTTTTAQGIEHIVLQGSGNAIAIGTSTYNVLIGNSGDNYLAGLGGNDTISGGIGTDRIVGGSGSDTMSGGTGNDTFFFASGFGNDRITDFDAGPPGGQDVLDLSALGITDAAFAARVTITDVGADTLVTIDNATQKILLAGINDATTITRSDFVLFAG
ncbi:MAG: peroxidase family protein [Hyphomicrobium sp.]